MDDEFKDNDTERGMIVPDRAGGTSSSDASGKPPANAFQVDKSFEPFINSLKTIGFVDAETAECAYVLQRIPYSQLAYYFRPVLSDANPEEPSVKAVHDLVVFDRRFQSVLFKFIGLVESQLRAQYSHWMRSEFGEFPQYDESLFTDKGRYDLDKLSYDSDVSKAKKSNKVMREVAEANDDKLPIGYAVQAMSFGSLSRFYANTASVEATRRVAQSFGSTWNEMTGWLRAISDVRNVCAHFGAYLSRKQMPTTPRKIRGLDAPNNKPPYIAVLLSYLLGERVSFGDKNLWYSRKLSDHFAEIVCPFETRYPHFMRELGFEEDWIGILAKASELKSAQ